MEYKPVKNFTNTCMNQFNKCKDEAGAEYKPENYLNSIFRKGW